VQLIAVLFNVLFSFDLKSFSGLEISVFYPLVVISDFEGLSF
jgi:hypothetical protein